MKSSWFPILLIAVLLGLLGLLATLQYQWLGQISNGERERLQRNLQMDTARFAEDFNREIQNAYFNFQLNADVWRDKNWNEFNSRYEFWRGRAAYQNLIKDFYFVELGESQNLSRYNRENKTFEAAEWTENLNNLKPGFAVEDKFKPIAEEIPALLMPVHEAQKKIERILIRTRNPETSTPTIAPDEMPKKYGVLIIELDENVIKNQLFPDLVKKYFSTNESANYKLAVVNRENQTIFQTENLTATDATAKLFELSGNNFIFYANREALSTIQGERKTMVLSASKIEKKTLKTAATRDTQILIDQGENALPHEQKTLLLPRIPNEHLDFQVNGAKPRVRIFEGEMSDENAGWTLNVQHTAGSLEKFITNTRNKNLAVSFGILSLLAVSIVLIFLSAQRAKLFAQRQVDFVSSVSHEFRTPLAVIYSASENLSDGVIRNEEKIANYGNLIKREGKKLSQMVEQILEFAGARSGRRKYDFRATDINKIINEAIAECQPMIEEKGFTVEKEVAENLPEILADEKALMQAVQNLIANSIKYCNGSKWVKISARNGNNKLKISVEDRGLGIQKSELGKIFEPFYRSKKVVDEQIHGNGLGLSLVKQTVEAHGGKIDVESEIGRGSKFTIHLSLNN